MSDKVYTRNVYGETLVELGEQNKDIVVLDADLSGSTRTSYFAKRFPERFFNFGVAEQNMMATAAGLASCGKIVFVSTFAMFAIGRTWDQFRNSVCYNNFNVKLVATHAGVTVGPDGASHQPLEDIALTRCIPNVCIVVPCDGPETSAAVTAACYHKGPVYVRLGRPKFPTVEGKGNFELGKAYVLKKGSDITLIACGLMVPFALDAASALEKKNISAEVINCHTIKPLDTETILKSLKKTKAVVTCEEHSVIGGLGSAVAEAVVEDMYSIPMLRIGVRDRFGQSGDPDDLLKEYGLTSSDIVKAAKTVVSKKK